MNGHPNTARPLHQVGACAGVQSVCMGQGSGTGEAATRVARTAGFVDGGDAQ